MIGKVAKAAAYTKSPKKAFAIFHPVKAAKLGLAFWIGKKLFGGKSRSA